ncbi:MAG TPA: PQQ-binding-like beta-propeller repeat protein [Gemmataceae bacterium]|nr:PQQ-binding-like beta-propeller repeat protein [Gemmataceae bacterium]
MRGMILIAIGFSVVCLPALAGEDWPQFRGPGGSATAPKTQLPDKWGADKNIAWKAKLPGYGWSSPIVWGDKVFLTTAVSDKQRKPAAGFGGRGENGGGPPGGRRPGAGGPGMFPGFAPPAQVMPDFLQGMLQLTDEQKKQIADLQKEADGKLDKILNDEQKKQLKDMRARSRGPGFGRMQKPPDAIYKLEVYCLDRGSGKVLWKQLAYEGKPRIPTQPSNTYATETPITDGQRLYAYFGMHGVYCYDLGGNLLWKKDLGSYPMALGFGTGSSPALADGRLFIQCDNEQKSFLAALDAATGAELWRVPRPERTGYSTPFVWKNKARTEVVCLGGSRVRSYDPATGKQLWELGGMAGQAKASPAASEELLYVGTGGGPGGGGGRGGPGGGFGSSGNRPLFAVKAGASGDISLKKGAASNDGIAWYQAKAGPQTASLLLYNEQLYILDEHGGFLSCYDAKTGEQKYKERLPGARGFTSSPWAADGKVFCLDDAGTTYIVQAGPAFKIVGKNTVEEMCWSSPAVAGHALFLRGVDHLFCIKAK